MIGPNRDIAKHVKSCTYCCYVRCATLVVRVGEMPWTKTGATINHAELGFQTKVFQSKGWLSVMWYGYDLWDGSLDQRKVRGVSPIFVVRMATKLKYCNTL